MNIRTKTFQIHPKEVQRLVINAHFRSNRILRILFIFSGVLIIIMFINKNLFYWWNLYVIGYYIVMIVSEILTPIIRLISMTSVLNLQSRFCEIDDNFLTIYLEDGSLIKIKYRNITEVTKIVDYYFIYLNVSKTQAHFLPIAAFESEHDLEEFESLLKEKQLISKVRI